MSHFHSARILAHNLYATIRCLFGLAKSFITKIFPKIRFYRVNIHTTVHRTLYYCLIVFLLGASYELPVFVGNRKMVVSGRAVTIRPWRRSKAKAGFLDDFSC